MHWKRKIHSVHSDLLVFPSVYGDSACEELKKEGSMPHQELLVSVASGNPMGHGIPVCTTAIQKRRAPGGQYSWCPSWLTDVLRALSRPWPALWLLRLVDW
jgi:hypothetical protein